MTNGYWLMTFDAMSDRTKPSSTAFTLLELVLVMLVVSTAVAIMVPSLNGWRKGSELRDAADAFVTMTNRARALAIADAVTYRVTANANGLAFSMTKESLDAPGQFDPVTGSAGRNVEMPDGAQATVTGGVENAIEFYPSGRMTLASVRFTDSRGYEVNVNCPSPAEGFAVVSPQGEGR
jgi:Tfp pilus assembly protein FimT